MLLSHSLDHEFVRCFEKVLLTFVTHRFWIELSYLSLIISVVVFSIILVLISATPSTCSELEVYGSKFHTKTMPDINSSTLPHSTIGTAETCDMKIWNKFWLRMSDLSHIGHPGKSCSLLFMICVGRTLELIVPHIPQRLGSFYLGSSCRCGTCTHCIWGSY